MKRILLLLAPVSLALCLLTTVLRAADEADNDAAIRANVKKHLPGTKITLEAAIVAAIGKHAGAKAVEAGFEIEGDEQYYVVEVVKGEDHFDVEVNALTGKIDSDDKAEDELPDEIAAEKAVVHGKIAIGAAVRSANVAIGTAARAFDAVPHMKEGKLIYQVGVLSGQDIYDVIVDGTTGKVLGKKKME